MKEIKAIRITPSHIENDPTLTLVPTTERSRVSNSNSKVFRVLGDDGFFIIGGECLDIEIVYEYDEFGSANEDIYPLI